MERGSLYSTQMTQVKMLIDTFTHYFFKLASCKLAYKLVTIVLNSILAFELPLQKMYIKKSVNAPFLKENNNYAILE